MRLWIKRGFTGTPASIHLDSDDLIDDVKDAVFRKYPIALARAFDAPDVSICLVKHGPKPASIETRILAVDEKVADVLRSHYPNGQRTDDALIIQIPSPQTRPSPFNNNTRHHGSPLSGTVGLLTTDMRDFEYFPATPPGPQDNPNDNNNRSNFVPSNYSSASQATYTLSAPSIEGSVRPAPNLSMSNIRQRDKSQRPAMGARSATQASSSQSIGGYIRSSDGSITLNTKSGRNSRAASSGTQYSQASPRLTRGDDFLPPDSVNAMNLIDGPEGLPNTSKETIPLGHRLSIPNTMTPLAEAAELNASTSSLGRSRRETGAQVLQRPGMGSRTLTQTKMNMVSPANSQHSSPHSMTKLDATELKQKSNASTFGVGGLLEGVVPPIDVLIVEDNMINQRILETFMKKRKIRCLTAKNGKEAVEKWKKGGIHLVLMDIQMPIMSGIEATKEIRRLERLNAIGVFSKKEKMPVPEPEDVLTELRFRSPVIIVALTASSLQSDRHEALAAGCNDFLTKPVSLVWLEKKVLEWGCMQALIDFEGWKKFRNIKGAEDK